MNSVKGKVINGLFKVTKSGLKLKSKHRLSKAVT